MTDTLYDELGGMPCLERVHKVFYDKLLRHPWLKEFFEGNQRGDLESQQSDFMARLFGGPNTYSGRLPKSAQTHMFITEEIFLIRHKILEEALTESGIRLDLMERWLDYDMGMKRALVKNSISECFGWYRSEPIIAVARP